MKKDLYIEANKQNAGTIEAKIHEETKIQTKEILDFAKNETQKIFNEANKKLQENKQKASSELERAIQAIKDRIFSALNLEKRRIILEEKNKFIQEVFDKVKQEAKHFRDSDDYPLFLKKAIAEAVMVIDEKNLVIFYSETDEKFINNGFIKDAQDFCRKSTNTQVLLEFKRGNFNDIGVVIESKDGRLIYENTFLSRLARVQDEIYMDLMRSI